MDDHADFDSVSWRKEPDNNRSRPERTEPSHETTLPSRVSNGKRRLSSHHQHHEPQAGQLAGPVDLGGIGDGTLECTVDSPLKENDGTKDAYVSYLITTTVGHPLLSSLIRGHPLTDHWSTDRLQIIPKTRVLHEAALHRFCVSAPDPISRVPGMRSTSLA